MSRNDLDEGRVRSGRGRLLALAMVGVLGGLWLLAGRFAGERGAVPTMDPDATAPQPLTTSLTGRLVYSTFASDGPLDRQQRLWVLDLASGRLTEGPLVPTAEELFAIGPDRSSVLVVSDLGRPGAAAFLLEDLAAEAVPVEVARGDLVSVSNRADAVVMAQTEPTAGPRCPGFRYVVSRASAVAGAPQEVGRGRIACGRLLSVTEVGSRVYASILRDQHLDTVVVSGRRLLKALPGKALVAAGPDGSWLTVGGDAGVVRPLGVWPGTATGPLAVSSPGPPTGRSPGRPLVPHARLFAERLVAWSRDGRAVVVSGIVGDERSMWLVRVAQGTVTRLLPPNSVPLRSAFSGATFDDADTLFVGSPGTIAIQTPVGRSLLQLPPEAPSPAGPLAWLP